MVTCPLKSQRGREIEEHWEGSTAAFTHQLNQLLANDDVQSNKALHDNLRSAGLTLLANIQLKLGFTRMMPWKLWRLRRSREAAQGIISEYDQHKLKLDTGRESKIHRITEAFARPDGRLREHLQVVTSPLLLPTHTQDH